MLTLNLSGFQPGDNLNISVSQGALTAGPVNVPAWGGAGGDGGTIAIVAERSELGVAPDSVIFSVDLSEATFDTQGPGEGEIYDARMHDLWYFWDFDDASTGDWSAPINVFSHWKNRNVALGPYVGHMYTSPGTYSPSVMVYEPSSGKMATATLSGGSAIAIADPDTVFAGTNTIVVNPTGDTTWTGKPAGAAELNATDILNATLSSYTSASDSKRFLFKRGETFNIGVNVDRFPNISFGSYGPSSEKPILNVMSINDGGDADGNAFNLSNQLYPGAFGSRADVRIYDLTIQGPFDPTTEVDGEYAANDKTYGVKSVAGTYLMLSNVVMDGLHGIMNLSETSVTRQVHIDDTVCSNMGDNYPLFIRPSDDGSSVGIITGSRIAQPPGAHDTNNSAYGAFGLRTLSTHSPVRWNDVGKIHMRGCDFFHTDRVHWSLRLNSGPERDGCICNIHSMSHEGGGGFLTFGGEPTNGVNRSIVGNVILDGIVYSGAYSVLGFIESYCSGMSVRNCLVIVPDCQSATTGGGMKNWIKMKSVPANPADETTVRAAPIAVYNNTFVFQRDPSENGVTPVALDVILDESDGFTGEVEANNVLHYPDYTPGVENDYAPLTSTYLPWKPRNIGKREPDGMVLDSSFATPTGKIAYDGGTDDAVAGEIVTSTSGGSATVIRQDGATSTGDLFVFDVTGTFANDDTLTGSTTGAFATAAANLENTGNLHYKPGPGSTALGAALSGNVSYMDILGTTRTAPADKGAWDVA